MVSRIPSCFLCCHRLNLILLPLGLCTPCEFFVPITEAVLIKLLV